MTDKYKTIREALNAADAALEEATKMAKASGEEFYWDGPTYGMGGSYLPNGYTDCWGDENVGWQASSMSC